MKAIQSYFDRLGRNPTDVELETIAQPWSEHCKHKTFSGVIEYEEKGRGSRVYDNLLKSTIMKATQELDKPWCWSTFKDNAGIIAFDDEWGVAFKAETHNHPSALEPYGGAGTGIGGVIRDILGVGLGAKPVMNTDVFAFAPERFTCTQNSARCFSSEAGYSGCHRRRARLRKPYGNPDSEWGEGLF